VLEIGVISAIAAGAANWLILHRATRRATRPAPGPDPGLAPDPGIDEERVGLGTPIPSVTLAAAAPLPSVVDETDDAGGHRIYLNPWADEDL
jgi:hypothetical protein